MRYKRHFNSDSECSSLQSAKGTKRRFVIKMLGLLMTYNICQILQVYLRKNNSFFIAFCVFMFIKDTCFNLSHWFFAYKYYSTARRTPYAIKGEDVPKSILSWDKATNRFFYVLNSIAVMLDAPTYYLYMTRGGEFWLSMDIGTWLFVISLTFISGIYLFVALYKIYKVMNAQNAGSVNIKAMTVHAMSFGLYMFSLVCALVVYGLVSETNVNLNLDALIFMDICAFVSQILLSLILWDLSKVE